jgi:hypothetical protein
VVAWGPSLRRGKDDSKDTVSRQQISHLERALLLCYLFGCSVAPSPAVQSTINTRIPLSPGLLPIKPTDIIRNTHLVLFSHAQHPIDVSRTLRSSIIHIIDNHGIDKAVSHWWLANGDPFWFHPWDSTVPRWQLYPFATASARRCLQLSGSR